MRTAQDIINAARFDLAVIIVTLMRKLDAYLATGKKNLMTAMEEDVIIYFAEFGNAPVISVKIDNSYLDVEDVCHETRPLDFITTETEDDHNFYVGVDGTDIDVDDLSTDELVAIAKFLEITYNEME